MSDQHFFTERLVVRGYLDFRGDSGQIAILFSVLCSQHQRDERGPRLTDFQTELAGNVIPERSRSQFWYRKPARCNHQNWRAKFDGFRANDESIRPANLLNLAVQDDLYSSGPAFGFEHFQNVLRGMVAEKLA